LETEHEILIEDEAGHEAEDSMLIESAGDRSEVVIDRPLGIDCSRKISVEGPEVWQVRPAQGTRPCLRARDQEHECRPHDFHDAISEDGEH
jgi:hypothetical protein